MAGSGQTDVRGAHVGGLQIDVTREGTTTTIALRGDWDLAEQDAVRSATRRALRRRPERLVLDLGGLTFMGSVGVHGTVELACRAARLNVELLIVPGSYAVQRVFEICQVTEWLPFIDRMPAA